MASPRELGTAIVLYHLLQRSGHLDTWNAMDNLIRTYVGWSDSLTFPQLGGVLAGAGMRNLSDVRNLQHLIEIQEAILQGKLGVQNIRSDFFVPPIGSVQIQLPRSLLIFGQRFVPDSWVLSQTVFDSIILGGKRSD
jgi:hypothetical protein